MAPERVQLRRTKGWRKPADAVVVARPTKWGNPFRVGQRDVPDAATAVELYRRCLRLNDFDTGRPMAETARRELRGKDLACWCDPGLPCHADVLLEVANG